MCGITGYINLDGAPASQAFLQRMTDVIVHRGPDGEGHWIEGNFAVGHRRLSIIDLSTAGHQPMMSSDRRFVISYNGEVYNFKELRIELEARGYVFHSNTDSEVVLNSLIEWGEKALLKFNGMFALALWDRYEKTLLLARDRYGIKPLYYTNSNNRLIFGSESKAIAAHPDFSSKMDCQGLLEYFTFQNFFTDRTLLEEVSMLPAGCLLKVSITDSGSIKSINQNRYWDYLFEEPESPRRDEDYLEELDYLLQQAVNRQMIADVEVGSYLSGGMDSGSLTAIASRQTDYMRTFTVGFDLSSASGMELNFDERTAAEQMSSIFKTEHYEMVLKAGDMERCMKHLAYHLEEPRVGQSYPNYYAAKLASKFNKVVLAGTGGDEIFGGYPWRYYRAVVNTDFDQYIDKYYNYWQRLIPNSDIRRVFAPIDKEVSNVWTRDIFHDVFASHANTLTKPEDYVNHSLYLEAKTFLHGLLVVEDKLSMAHSLETRVPFLDNDLVEFAMKLPTHLKLGKLREVVKLNENTPGEKTARYFQKTQDGKLLLRKAMTRHLPREVVEREKQGFSAPDASWFKGESIEYVKRTLNNPSARLYNFLDRDEVQRLVSEHLEGQNNRRLLIWSLLNVEHWCEQYL